ncbi:MAG: hypothetical protein FP831_16420 [Anaerolineae bacterium]|jgi:hypothetical protein|nr:hypothetical protein [Anaerolineae bacterium]PKO02029.1 MAG: hypothetical protein CVU43_10065 [Chloroflexi bacterium HGW-Chloroflexi-5]
MPDLKFVALVFGIILLIVLGVRQGMKKARKLQETGDRPVKIKEAPQKPKMTEAQFDQSWKNLSYLLLLAAAGSLYMVYMATKAALSSVPAVAWVYWIDASFSFAAAVSGVLIWHLRTKSMVFLYFGFTIVPIILFMSIKGFKIDALIHLFPLVLLYFVLKPVWENMKN